MVVMMTVGRKPASIMGEDRLVHTGEQDREHSHEPDKDAPHGMPDSRPMAAGQSNRRLCVLPAPDLRNFNLLGTPDAHCHADVRGA